MKTVVIIPAYNEEEIIAETIRSVQKEAPWADILVINDASADGTLSEIRKCAVPYLNHPVNLGIGGAMQSGFRYAHDHGYDFAAQIDGDGQHDPAYIRVIMEGMARDGADVGIGSRFIERKGFQSSHARRLGIRFLSGLVKLMCGASVSDVTSGMRVINRRFIAIFAESYSDDYPETDSIPVIVQNGGIIGEYPVVMRERKTGKSSIGLTGSVYYMVKVSLSLLLTGGLRYRRRRKEDENRTPE
jgi:hypothetical protein